MFGLRDYINPPEQTMCSPWEEAAQPQGERREAAAGAVSISDCPAEEQGGGGSSGLLGGRSASLTLPGDFSALRGQRDASRAGCVPSSPPWRGKQSPASFSPFSAFFSFLTAQCQPLPSSRHGSSASAALSSRWDLARPCPQSQKSSAGEG